MISGSRGVTIVELLIAMSVGLVAVGAVYTIFLVQTKNQLAEEDVLAMQQSARAAMDLIGREVRMAGYDPKGVNRDQDPLNDFEGIRHSPMGLTIQSDLNGNGILTDSNEIISYSYDSRSETLRRRTGRGGRQPVADHIVGFWFQFFDPNGQPVTEPTDIRGVEVILKAKTQHAEAGYASNDGYRVMTLRSRIALRNVDR